MNSLMFPFSIHSDTITNCSPFIITPCSGSTFGWLRAFQVITSLQNLCANDSQLGVTKIETPYKQHTLLILSKSLVEYALKPLAATGRPWHSPFHTSAYPPLYCGAHHRLYRTGICSGFGSKARRPQILHKALKHFPRSRGGRWGGSRALLV